MFSLSSSFSISSSWSLSSFVHDDISIKHSSESISISTIVPGGMFSVCFIALTAGSGHCAPIRSIVILLLISF